MDDHPSFALAWALQTPLPQHLSIPVPYPKQPQPWFRIITYRHHRLWWTQASQVTNANNEGTAGCKVMVATLQEAGTQLEQLGKMKHKREYHQWPAHQVMSPSASPHSLLKAVQSFPNLIYCPTQPSAAPTPMSNSQPHCHFSCFPASFCMPSSKFLPIPPSLLPKSPSISTPQISSPVQSCLPLCVLFK